MQYLKVCRDLFLAIAHVLNHTVDTKKYSTIDSTTRRVKVTGSIAVSDFELVVSDSREGREGSTYKAEYPKTIEENIQVQKKQFIHVQFKIR